MCACPEVCDSSKFVIVAWRSDPEYPNPGWTKSTAFLALAAQTRSYSNLQVLCGHWHNAKSVNLKVYSFSSTAQAGVIQRVWHFPDTSKAAGINRWHNGTLRVSSSKGRAGWMAGKPFCKKLLWHYLLVLQHMGQWLLAPQVRLLIGQSQATQEPRRRYHSVNVRQSRFVLMCVIMQHIMWHTS